jgi:predicted Ser/Thr protein kinase
MSNIKRITLFRLSNTEIQTSLKSNPEITKKHQISFVSIEFEKELGKGSYGKVMLGRWNGAPVALKFCKESEKLDDFLKEANLMTYIKKKISLFDILLGLI